MIVTLGAIGLVLVAAPAWVAPLGRHLHPADWARWVAGSLALGAVALEAAMLFTAAPTVLHAAGVHGLADACIRMAGSAPPGGAPAGWAAAAVAVALPTMIVSSWWINRQKQRRIAAAVAIVPAADRFGGDVFVVPYHDPLAFSVPHTAGGRVVVSTALATALSESELAAVVRHERAHLRYRHGSYLMLGAALDRALVLHPFVRASTAQLRCALERWADEEAAGATAADRATARGALLAAALAPLPVAVAGFGPVETVAARVAALERPAQRSTPLSRLVATAPLLALTFVVAGTAGSAGGDIWAVLTMPVRCALRQA